MRAEGQSVWKEASAPLVKNFGEAVHLNYLSKKIYQANSVMEKAVRKNVPEKWAASVENVIRAAPFALAELVVPSSVTLGWTLTTWVSFRVNSIEMTPAAKAKLCRAISTSLLMRGCSSPVVDSNILLNATAHLLGGYAFYKLAEMFENSLKKKKDS